MEQASKQANKQTNKQTDEDRTTDIRQTNKETNVYWECISAKNYFYYSQKPCRNPSRCFEQKNSLIMYGWSVRALTGSAAHSSVMIWHLKKQPYPNFQAVAKSKPRPPESPPARRCTGQQPHARARGHNPIMRSASSNVNYMRLLLLTTTSTTAN